MSHSRAILLSTSLLAFVCLGCGKKDAEKGPNALSASTEHVGTAAGPAKAQATVVPPLPSASQNAPVSEFSGEVTKGHGFEKALTGGLVFRLQPDAGGYAAWEIRLALGTEPSPASIDCIGAVSEPLHGDDHLFIEPPGLDKVRDDTNWKKREFDFVPNASDCKRAWDLSNEAHYPSKLTDKQREEADANLAKIHTGHGAFEIIDSRLSKPATKEASAQIEWLKFAVRLEFSQATEVHATSSAKSQMPSKGIHDVDVKDFLNTHYTEIDPDLENLKDECAEGEDAIKSVDIQYGDVDGDGQDEALFQGFTCMSGSAGVDYAGILKLQPNGKFVSLPIAKIPDTFKGRTPFEGLRGHVRWDIENGRFVETYPVYKGDECEACSEGGERKFVFRWDGHQLVLDNIVDIPPEKSAN